MTALAPRCPSCKDTRMGGSNQGPCITCAPNVSRAGQTRRAKAANAADYAARGFSETRIIRNPAAYYGH